MVLVFNLLFFDYRTPMSLFLRIYVFVLIYSSADSMFSKFLLFEWSVFVSLNFVLLFFFICFIFFLHLHKNIETLTMPFFFFIFFIFFLFIYLFFVFMKTNVRLFTF